MVRVRSLGSEREFARVVRNGRAGHSNGITVFVDDREPEGAPGVGLSVRVRGSAVRRNRVKRRLRAALDQCPRPSRDIVVRADGTVAEMEYQKLVTQLSEALRTAGGFG